MNVMDAIEKVESWEDAVSLAHEIIQTGSDWSYHLGDLVLRVRGAPKTGDLGIEQAQQQTLRAFSKEIGQSYESLKDSYRVAKYVPVALRSEYPILSYGHWREITKSGIREPADIRQWADNVVSNEWSVTALRNALHKKPEPKTADRWQKLTRKAYRVLEEMSEFDLATCWRAFPDETGLMVKSLSSCLKTIEAAWAEASRTEKAAEEIRGMVEA